MVKINLPELQLYPERHRWSRDKAFVVLAIPREYNYQVGQIFRWSDKNFDAVKVSSDSRGDRKCHDRCLERMGI
jgi:hypothetical protein